MRNLLRRLLFLTWTRIVRRPQTYIGIRRWACLKQVTMMSLRGNLRMVWRQFLLLAFSAGHANCFLDDEDMYDDEPYDEELDYGDDVAMSEDGEENPSD